MFIDNKYKKWYFEIINRAKDRKLSIYEKHHIIPKSLGGSNNKSNIANLSPREHFICHHLLTKMTEGKNLIKMRYAFWSMTRNTKRTNRIISSKQYEIARKSFIQNTKNKSYDEIYGKEKSAEIRKKRSESTKGVSRPWAGSDGIHPKTGHNRFAKVWEVTTPEGIVVRLIGSEFTQFCITHKLSKGNFSMYGKTKGFHVICLGLASKLM